MTISGVLNNEGSINPGDQFRRLAEEINEKRDEIFTTPLFELLISEEDSFEGNVDFNFYARDRLPGHVQELYDKFTKFIVLYYKFLEDPSRNTIASVESSLDVDFTPDNLVMLFKRVYAEGFPDRVFYNDEEEGRVTRVDFINPSQSQLDVRNFLKYVKDFYKLKSNVEAYNFFFRALFNASPIEISYPKTVLHFCSEGAYRPETDADENTTYYENDYGLISGFSRLPDNQYFQNFSYLIDSTIDFALYERLVRRLLHPAGLFLAGNFTLNDEFDQPGTTGTTNPIEIPIIGHYAPYRFNTTVNLRSNASGVDLYPCGYNPYLVAGSTYTSQHLQDSGGLYYKSEAGATAHEPAGTPLGLAGHTGSTAAGVLDYTFFRIFHHPNSWTRTIPSGDAMKNIVLGSMVFLEPLNNESSPNDPNESSSGCGF